MMKGGSRLHHADVVQSEGQAIGEIISVSPSSLDENECLLEKAKEGQMPRKPHSFYYDHTCS